MPRPELPQRDRAERAARNQALFREVNERINDVHAGFAPAATFQIVCECADPGCTEQIELTTATYEAVRSHADRFIVEPEHVWPEVERDVERGDGYVVVEKLRRAAQVARATDPRSR